MQNTCFICGQERAEFERQQLVGRQLLWFFLKIQYSGLANKHFKTITLIYFNYM